MATIYNVTVYYELFTQLYNKFPLRKAVRSKRLEKCVKVFCYKLYIETFIMNSEVNNKEKQFMSTGTAELLQKRHLKLEEKLCRYRSHLTFLSECDADGIIPNGFRLKWTLNLGNSTEGKNDNSNVDSIMNEASRKLIRESIEVCKIELKNTENVLSTVVDQIKTSLGESVLLDIQNSQKSALNALSDKITRTKQKKIKMLRNAKSHQTIHRMNNVKTKHMDISKDGNCFFRCVSQFMYNTQNRHLDVRQQIMSTIIDNKEYYSELIEGNFQTHVDNVSSPKAWATEAEILAASETFNIDIFVKTKVGSTMKWNRYSRNPNCDHSSNFMTIMHENSHFSLILNLERPCSCLKKKN